RPSELGEWIREAGLEITDMTGLLYNPLTKTYKLSERDVDVNYMISARKPN
ncbi:bifunctional 3-demethylubiquinol 3-O-methyltransferase/2-polyprenyl-6-hydroxyphenol methylase, partial [Porticoccaceae bacterium]|nr:bifunctional 3-demethylubiquinol 3-O-methyltransferase/2-polyprenyl-6-hydroxyphenol methylase [Porticoccaceae bacterium]